MRATFTLLITTKKVAPSRPMLGPSLSSDEAGSEAKKPLQERAWAEKVRHIGPFGNCRRAASEIHFSGKNIGFDPPPSEPGAVCG
mmetsp:Transcript_3556/g.6816  ORF Transcript_3556/g.6816 Transcript_3556/m.6816 type:complete len:85 (-) Transcript_3556:213-467(-)